MSTFNFTSRIPQHALIGALVLISLICIPQIAFAAPWDSAAQQVLSIFTGGLSRTIAIIAVVALGLAALAGKLSWNWAINIAVGLVLIFGSAAIVDYIIIATA